MQKVKDKLQSFTRYKIINFVIVSALFIKQSEGVIKNDDIHSLAKDIPNIIVHCREENTVKKYNSSFKVWELWAKQHNCTTLPAKSFTVVFFLMNCIYKRIIHSGKLKGYNLLLHFTIKSWVTLTLVLLLLYPAPWRL